jgi:hypothetical protein
MYEDVEFNVIPLFAVIFPEVIEPDALPCPTTRAILDVAFRLETLLSPIIEWVATLPAKLMVPEPLKLL